MDGAWRSKMLKIGTADDRGFWGTMLSGGLNWVGEFSMPDDGDDKKDERGDCKGDRYDRTNYCGGNIVGEFRRIGCTGYFQFFEGVNNAD